MIRLILLGLVVFAGTLALTLPAPRIAAALQGPVQLYGVEGSLLSGRVQGLAYQRQPLAQNLRWQLLPWGLPLLRASYQLRGELQGDGFEARLNLGATGAHSLQDFRGEFDLRSLAALAGQSYLPLQGRALADLAELHWRAQQLGKAQGELRLLNLQWTLAQSPLPLGDYSATLAPEGEDLGVTIKSLSGPLEVEGDARYRPDRRYELHLQLRPRADTDPVLVNLLRTLGTPDNQSWYHLRRNGQL